MTQSSPNEVAVSVLVIDDDAMLRSFIVELLKRRGYAVVDAENGLDAFSVIGNRSFDLIITDIVMPDMEGLATIRQLRAKFGAAPRIVAISGEGGDRTQYLRHAAAFGADATLEKPFAPPVLLSLLERLMDPRAQAGAAAS